MAIDVSVIMAVRNGQRTLSRAITSILCQTHTDFEFIIVDDASTDGTSALLSTVALEDKRIKVLRNTRRLGLAGSLNNALKAARGSMIARMDADDRSYEDRLATQLTFLSDHPDIGVLGSAATLVSSEGVRLGVAVLPCTHEDLVSRIWFRNPFIHPSVMVRSEVFSALHGYDSSLYGSEDYDLWLRARKNFRFHNLAVPLIEYTVAGKTKWRDVIWNMRVHSCVVAREGFSIQQAYGLTRWTTVALLGATGIRRPRLR